MVSIYGKALSKTMNAFGNLLFPNCCRYCRSETALGGGLCRDCWERLPYVANKCRHCAAEIVGTVEPLCMDCYFAPRVWRNGYAAAPYEGLARELVLGLKYGHQEGYAKIMAVQMARQLRPAAEKYDHVFAMPIHWRRKMKRGFNQSEMLARHLAKAIGSHYCGGLKRTRHTKPQDRSFDAAMRYENVAGAMKYNGPSLVGRKLLLVDDVLTSGASLTHATYALLTANPEVIDIIVFARAPQRH